MADQSLIALAEKCGAYEWPTTFAWTFTHVQLQAFAAALARNDQSLIAWIINNLLTERQLDVVPPGYKEALRFLAHEQEAQPAHTYTKPPEGERRSCGDDVSSFFRAAQSAAQEPSKQLRNRWKDVF